MSTLRAAIAALVDEPGMDVCSCQACASTLDAFTLAIYRAGILRGREDAARRLQPYAEFARAEFAARGSTMPKDVDMALEVAAAGIRDLPAPVVTLDDEVPT